VGLAGAAARLPSALHKVGLFLPHRSAPIAGSTPWASTKRKNGRPSDQEVGLRERLVDTAQSIRTEGEVPFEVALKELAEPSSYLNE
jgi:hypothetical protein